MKGGDGALIACVLCMLLLYVLVCVCCLCVFCVCLLVLFCCGAASKLKKKGGEFQKNSTGEGNTQNKEKQADHTKKKRKERNNNIIRIDTHYHVSVFRRIGDCDFISWYRMNLNGFGR